MSGYYAHPSAVIDEPVTIGEGTRIWHFSHVMKGAVIGAGCVFGQGTFVAGSVRIGDGVKVQNNVSIYDGTVIEDGVFLGPSCVLTNVTNPRAEIERKSLYETTLIRRGASVGANATIVCGVTIGRYAFIGAGSVVTSNVGDYALMTGVPARRVGWMSRHAQRLELASAGDVCACPESGLRYELTADGVRCVDLAEDAPLPEHLTRGTRPYRAEPE
jgi:UDP-2-acetamido-3-amino-2,3-dideoxy-glucuronate N-acetyltransferase